MGADAVGYKSATMVLRYGTPTCMFLQYDPVECSSVLLNKFRNTLKTLHVS